ncbi:unnamed protein product [Urochloa decumbens]|uniref:DUF1618 domain-containing protein n=1 Tax=Urochloa decumbens TaxID=240449 RepID=A0ABC9CUL3_9POAL
MAPACVLVDRFVNFVDDPVLATLTHLGLVGEEEETDGGAWKEAPNWDETPSWEAITKGIATYLQSMKPDPQVFAPPTVSSLSLVRPPLSSDPVLEFGRQLDSAFIAAAENNLVALYAGPYRPASSSEGCYLVYDACTNTVSTIPGIPYSASYFSVGNGTIIMADAHQDPGTFILAELLKLRSTPHQAKLCLWFQKAQSWVEKVVRLPTEVCPPKHMFDAHMAFSFDGKLFWVDLLHGLLIYDLKYPADGHPDFCFVQLPCGHSINTTSNPDHQLRPQEFRSMACVAGTIKFVNIDGYLQASKPVNQLTLTTWTLDMDDLSHRWTQETKLCLGDLLADETFLSSDLTKMKPMYPVLSTQEHDVVYLVVGGVKAVGNHRVKRAQHLLSVNTRRSKVVSSTSYQEDIWPQLFASDFNLYLQGSKHYQRGISN